MSTLSRNAKAYNHRKYGKFTFYDASDQNYAKIEQEQYDFEDSVLRLFRGQLTLEQIESMPKKELMARMDARARALQKDEVKSSEASNMIIDEFDGY